MAENQNINQYFDGDMSPEEMQAFETQIAQDPVLQKEFQFEKELIEGIKDTRKAELKAKLSNIDVSGATTTSTISTAKVLTGVVATGIIAVSGYFYFQEDDVTPVQDNSIVEVEEVPVSEDATSLESTQPPEEVTENTTTEEESTADNEEVVTTTENSTVQETESSTEIDFNEANISESFEEEDEEVSETAAPANHLIAKSKMVISPMNVVVEDSKRFTNHYQVKNGALILYGDFTELYEVIDFHKDGNIRTYFKYSDNYYKIDKSQSKPTELVALSGDDLLELLDMIENNKQR